MIINKDTLKDLKPCTDRYKAFCDNYRDFTGSFDEFIDLEKVTYEDKIWVARRILNKNQLCHFGLLCAESVLNIFDSKYPKDKRVRNCIEYLKGIKDFSNITDIQREEILKHKQDVAAAAAAAYAAAYADADADAYAAAAAAYAAAYADADAAADAYAADADAYAYAAAKKDQQNLNLQFLKMAASI